MKIRANHLTALRIILLPLPYFLLYGDVRARIAALMAFTLLGLTDYLDGLLARRDGSTPLGKLLDPIADKIFIAVTLIPLVDLGILPLWIVWPIFFREFLVTEFRKFCAASKKQLRVTELAKIKTTLQMTGAGLILITDMFPDKTVLIAFLSGTLLATIFLAVGLYWRDGHLSTRMQTASSLLALGLAVGLALKPPLIIITYGLVMLGITLVSGSQYLIVGLPEGLRQGLTALGRLIASLILPLLSLALMPSAPREMTSLVVLIVALEFGSQGLDMWAVQEGEIDISWIKRRILVPVALLSPVLVCVFYGFENAIPAFLLITTGLCICYAAANCWIYWRAACRTHNLVQGQSAKR
ncbi:MAG: CDP-alcohol phosphatidyltransferase family protein [Deltaproteobacteria bacterium]|nr:CDP-alcohol phosphatidyltransferase family protein [Deltaproteobacteria bacterium]MDL1960856.1 CDP-alcohol phosphatidyltransferase family protein [Deltaproteobacteria bacterium]